MKKFIVLAATFTVLTVAANAQTRKDGQPDMRFKVNREASGFSTPSYSQPTYSQPRQERNYNGGGELRLQKGYTRSDGSFVNPHVKTSPDGKSWNNIGR